MKKGEIKNFPSDGDKQLKDLIIKLLNPNPQKRLGFDNSEELINHPFFNGCFEENGKIKKEVLVPAAFKVPNNQDEHILKPIPHEFLFRTDAIDLNENPDFSIQGFTHFNNSVSKVNKN
jgi:hypothetical protein